FGATLRDNTKETSAILEQVMPDDLLKYGLIPEFVGRLPVVVPLQALDEGDLMRILTEPKNAIVKQYQKFLALDKVELQMTSDALQAAAKGAAKRKTGARGLRTIIEEVLLDVMYEIPSRTDVRKVVVTAESIEGRMKPLLLSKNQQQVLEGDEATASWRALPKLFYASPRDLPLIEPSPGVKGRVVNADHATVIVYEYAAKTVIETHKH